jgi:hypothetical protein
MRSPDLFIWCGNVKENQLAHDCMNFPFEELFGPDVTPLCSAMNRFGSDKGSGWHNYTKLYHHLLSKKSSIIENVFELGLGTNNIDTLSSMGVRGKPGASLRAWKDYFPKAQIHGADIDKRILFEEPRIRTFYCDQTNPADISALWQSIPRVKFDLMVDDGLHEFQANKIFLQNSIQNLAEDGLFIIEDVLVHEPNLQNFKDFMNSMNLQSVIIKLPSELNNNDNCLILIKRPKNIQTLIGA